MLTSLYNLKEILKSLLSGVPILLPGGFNSRSLMMGLMGRWSYHVDFPIAAIAEAFGVTIQAVYGNINRLQQLEAKIDAQPDLYTARIRSTTRLTSSLICSGVTKR